MGTLAYTSPLTVQPLVVGGHFGEGEGETFTIFLVRTVFFLMTGFFVIFGVGLALGFEVGFLVGWEVAANAVLVEAIIATATIIESTRPLTLDSI